MCEYEEFLIYDYKKRKSIKCSCDRDVVRNVCDESDIEFSRRPAFFNMESMGRFDCNKNKYENDGTFIRAKDWTLRYGFSADGSQIVIFIKYLEGLPIDEQRYWLFFNEECRSGLSDDLIKNELGGLWSESKDLILLKSLLKNYPKLMFDNKELIILEKKLNSAPNRLVDLSYAHNNSIEEWKNGILTINLNIIEAFNLKNLQQIAKELGCGIEEGSLKQLHTCLDNINKVSENEVEIIMRPLYEIRKLRNGFISHPNSEEISIVDFRENLEELISKVYQSIFLLSKIIENDFYLC